MLLAHAHNQQISGSYGLANPRTDRSNEVIFIITVALVTLAAVNVIFITWATALDARRSSALERALGATPEQVAAGLSMAQVLPAVPAAALGIPAGLGLYEAVSRGAPLSIGQPWWLIAVGAGTLLAVAALTAIPARIGGRRPPAEVLQAETA